MVNKHECWLCDQFFTELIDLAAHVMEDHKGETNGR
jgi:hypothetical protein